MYIATYVEEIQAIHPSIINKLTIVCSHSLGSWVGLNEAI